MSDKIFLSYSRFDSAFALRLANDIRNAGLCVWLDQLDIPPGEHWDKEIETALNSANCVLAIISPKSLASDNAMDEVSYALEEKKKVIPIMLTNTETPFRLRRLQRVDFTGDYDKGFKQLLASLKLENHAVDEMQKKPEQEDNDQQAKDQELWEESCRLNTVVAYQKYLRSTKSKLHLDEAWSRLESLQEKPPSRAIRFPQTAKKGNWLYNKKNVLIPSLLILLAVSGLCAYKIISNKALLKNSEPPAEHGASPRHSESVIVKPQDTSVALESNQQNIQNTDKPPAQQPRVDKLRVDKLIKRYPAVPGEKNNDVSVEKLPDATKVETTEIPSPPPTEKKELTINSKVIVNLMLIDKPDMHEEDKTEQFLQFSVTTDVVYGGEIIIQKGAIAKGSLTIGRMLTDIRLISVAGVSGDLIPLVSEKSHGRRADVEASKNYIAIIKEGTRVRN